MNKIPDLLGWNIYPGWYSGWGTKNDFGAMLDKHRRTSRPGGFCVSEYGAGANAAQHEQNPKQPKPTANGIPKNGRRTSTKSLGGDERAAVCLGHFRLEHV